MNAPTKLGDKCPVCGSVSTDAFRSEYVAVAVCGNADCGHLHAISAAEDHGVQAHAEAEVEAAMYQRRNARLVGFWRRCGFLPHGVRVLDVGAGAGHIASTIAGAVPDAHITCIEADADSCRSLLARGFTCYDRLDLCTESFDAILLVEVIEHIATPVEFLRECAAHLRPGAKMFLSTPCGETSKGSRKTNAYETREHVQFFTELSLNLACKRAGLRVLGFEAVTELYPRREGLNGVVDELKFRLMPLRDQLRGRSHLVSFLARAD